MNPLYRVVCILVALLAIGPGTGCADSVKPAGGAAEAKATRWVQAPPKPSGSRVNLRYNAPDTLKRGEVGTVRLQFSDVESATGARLEVRTNDPALTVVLDGGNVTGPITMVRGDFIELEAQVSAKSEGLYYLSVFTTQDGRFTATSIPVQVGSGESRQQKPQGRVLTTPSGERVRSLPGK